MRCVRPRVQRVLADWLMRIKRKRAPLSMTSLIDVIFLLLLFFMLSSTFSAFAEIPFSTAASGGAPGTKTLPPVILRLTPSGATVNGQTTTAEQLPGDVQKFAGPNLAETPILVSLTEGAKSKLLVQTLYHLRQMPDARVTVLD